MNASDLPNPLDRKHASRAERRRCACTYERKYSWRWQDIPSDYERKLNIGKFDKRCEREFQEGRPLDD